MMIGGAASPMTSQWLIDWVGWRWTFAVFAVLGVFWAIAFYAWFHDHPSEHPSSQRGRVRPDRRGPERLPADAIDDDALPGEPIVDKGIAHGPIPWDRVVPCANIWLLSGTMVTMSATYEILSSWYPTYLQEARGHHRPCPAGWRAWCRVPGH